MNTIVERGRNSAGNFLFLPYNAKAPITEKGLRTVKCLYKSTSGKNNVCALIPPIAAGAVQEKIADFLPHFVGFLETQQDAIIKELHVSDSATFADTQFSLDAILAKLNEEKASGRMSKEAIINWFDESMLESLTVLFAEKLKIGDSPTQEEIDKLESFLNVYKVKFAGLASGSTFYHAEDCDKLLIAMQKCEVDLNDSVAARIREKLEKMKTPVDVSALLDL